MIINQNSFKEEKESFNELIEFIQRSLAAAQESHFIKIVATKMIKKLTRIYTALRVSLLIEFGTVH